MAQSTYRLGRYFGGCGQNGKGPYRFLKSSSLRFKYFGIAARRNTLLNYGMSLINTCQTTVVSPTCPPRVQYGRCNELADLKLLVCGTRQTHELWADQWRVILPHGYFQVRRVGEIERTTTVKNRRDPEGQKKLIYNNVVLQIFHI